MSLSKSVEEKPDESPMAVFRTFATHLMSMQHQLHSDFHTVRYRRDMLMSAIDLLDIQNILRDRTPRTSHKLINRAANRLSINRGSSGSEASITQRGDDGPVDDRDLLDALNTPGKRSRVMRRSM